MPFLLLLNRVLVPEVFEEDMLDEPWAQALLGWSIFPAFTFKPKQLVFVLLVLVHICFLFSWLAGTPTVFCKIGWARTLLPSSIVCQNWWDYLILSRQDWTVLHALTGTLPYLPKIGIRADLATCEPLVWLLIYIFKNIFVICFLILKR